MDVEAVSLGYKIAPGHVPPAVLKKAITDIIRGQAQGLSRVFLPTSAELATYCDKICEATQLTIKTAQRLLDAPEETGRHKSLDADKMRRIESSLEKAQSTRH